MSSHVRPCYQVLSQYTQNGINPIIAPTPAETEPQMYVYFKPRQLNQKNYEMHKKMYETPSQPINRRVNYSNISQMCGESDKITPL